MHFTPSPITMLATDGTVSLNLLNVATLPVHSLSHLVYVGGCCLSTTSFSSITFSIAFPLFSVILLYSYKLYYLGTEQENFDVRYYDYRDTSHGKYI